MPQPRVLQDEEVEKNPLLRDLLERALSGGESILSYHGVTVSVMPIEDITHTFTPEELAEFLAGHTASGDPTTHLTVAEAMARYRSRTTRHG